MSISYDIDVERFMLSCNGESVNVIIATFDISLAKKVNVRCFLVVSTLFFIFFLDIDSCNGSKYNAIQVLANLNNSM